MAQNPETTIVRVRSAPRPSAAHTRSRAPQSKTPLIVVLIGPDAGRRIAVEDGIIIGRDVDGQGLVVDEGISRRHLRVSRQSDGTYLVEDLGSRNGTFVNGQRIEAAPLQSGDKLSIGSGTTLLFTRNDRYEEQVVRAQKMQALGQLAGGVSHDFNNLVLTMRGNVDYLSARDPNAPLDVQECLQEIETAARRVGQLTKQLLSFTNQRDAMIEPVDIPALIHETTTLLRRTVARDVELITDISPGLVVIGDSTQLLQVLINVGINAGQAMPQGGHMLIRAQRLSMHTDTIPVGLPPGSYICIEVQDSGDGMDADILARAFEPFFSTRPEGEGTGLGLSTAQSVVRDYGGVIDLRSRVGEGTCVSIYLPASDPSQPLPAASETVLSPLEGSVLMIDEEALVRMTSRRLLRSFGLDVQIAADSHDAMQIIKKRHGRIDVIIIGDELPGTSVESLLCPLRELAPHARLMVSTSQPDPDRQSALEALGIHGILRKPYGARLLWGKVWSALRS